MDAVCAKLPGSEARWEKTRLGKDGRKMAGSQHQKVFPRQGACFFFSGYFPLCESSIDIKPTQSGF